MNFATIQGLPRKKTWQKKALWFLKRIACASSGLAFVCSIPAHAAGCRDWKIVQDYHQQRIPNNWNYTRTSRKVFTSWEDGPFLECLLLPVKGDPSAHNALFCGDRRWAAGGDYNAPSYVYDKNGNLFSIDFKNGSLFYSMKYSCREISEQEVSIDGTEIKTGTVQGRKVVTKKIKSEIYKLIVPSF